MDIKVRIDDHGFRKRLGYFGDLLPKAESRAINRTLLIGQKAQVDHIHSRFVIRRPQFVKFSVTMAKFAKENDLTGTLAIADIRGKGTADILDKFESGDDKTGSGNIAIPTRAVQPSRQRLVSKRNKPRNLPKSFKARLKSGSEAILRRKGREKVRRQKLRMYCVRPSG